MGASQSRRRSRGAPARAPPGHTKAGGGPGASQPRAGERGGTAPETAERCRAEPDRTGPSRTGPSRTAAEPQQNRVVVLRSAPPPHRSPAPLGYVQLTCADTGLRSAFCCWVLRVFDWCCSFWGFFRLFAFYPFFTYSFLNRIPPERCFPAGLHPPSTGALLPPSHLVWWDQQEAQPSAAPGSPRPAPSPLPAWPRVGSRCRARRGAPEPQRRHGSGPAAPAAPSMPEPRSLPAASPMVRPRRGPSASRWAGPRRNRRCCGQAAKAAGLR